MQVLTLERAVSGETMVQAYSNIRMGHLPYDKLAQAPYSTSLKMLASIWALLCPSPQSRMTMGGLLEALSPMVDPTVQVFGGPDAEALQP